MCVCTYVNLAHCPNLDSKSGIDWKHVNRCMSLSFFSSCFSLLVFYIVITQVMWAISREKEIEVETERKKKTTESLLGLLGRERESELALAFTCV